MTEGRKTCAPKEPAPGCGVEAVGVVAGGGGAGPNSVGGPEATGSSSRVTDGSGIGCWAGLSAKSTLLGSAITGDDLLNAANGVEGQVEDPRQVVGVDAIGGRRNRDGSTGSLGPRPKASRGWLS